MTRCDVCPRQHDPVPGDGPRGARVMLIGEAPGENERQGMRPFIGKAGQELNEHYLPLAGLHRDNVYITNAVKCFWAAGGNAPPSNIVQSCAAHHLPREVQAIRPELIVTMGAVAGSVVKWPRPLHLDMHHGLGMGDVRLHGVHVVPIYHPAVGLHKTDMIGRLREDFKMLRTVLRGQGWKPAPPLRYGVLQTKAEIAHALSHSETLAIDTETTNNRSNRLWCTTFTTAPGEGWMVLRSNRIATLNLFHRLRTWPGRLVMHNAPFDRRVLYKAGCDLGSKLVHDTMLKAYELCSKPRGLKLLAYRRLGIVMTDFEDTVLPPSREVLMDYVGDAMSHDEVWQLPPSELVPDGKGGTKKYQPQRISTKIKRMVTDWGKNSELDVFGRLANWTPGERAVLERVMGAKVPQLSIVHVDLDVAARYACEDARATWELDSVLRGEMVRFRDRRF